MSTLLASPLSLHVAPESRLTGHELDLSQLEAQYAAQQCELAEAAQDDARQQQQHPPVIVLRLDNGGDDDRTPPPSGGALKFPEVLTLPDFALIAAIEAADRHDPALRVSDYDGFLHEASAELCRRLALADAVRTFGYGSPEHCKAQAAQMSTPDLIASLRAPERSLFSRHAASAYSVELVGRLRANLAPKAKPARRRWKKTIGKCANGDRLIKYVASDCVAALARPGMIINDCENSLESVIETIHADFCVARTREGKLVTLLWHEVNLLHVRPDPSALANVAA